jgi:hypothetical protein
VRRLRFSASVVAVLMTAACGGSTNPYTATSDRLTVLSGSPPPPRSLSVVEAMRNPPARPAFVRGYVIVHVDDRDRLCRRLDGSADCGSAPSMILEGLGARSVSGMKNGCCAMGSWSTHPLAILGKVAGGVFHVAPDAP